jgi:hypothetical protein
MRKGGEPPEECGDAFNEDLSRILLGEFLTAGVGATVPGNSPRDVLRHAGPLLDELARIARAFERNPDRTPRAVQADARRIRQIAATLAELLGLPRAGRAAA